MVEGEIQVRLKGGTMWDEINIETGNAKFHFVEESLAMEMKIVL